MWLWAWGDTSVAGWCEGCVSATSSAVRERAVEEPPEHQTAPEVLKKTSWTEQLPLWSHLLSKHLRGWGQTARTRSGSSLTSTTQIKLEGTAKMWTFHTQLSDINKLPEGGAFGCTLVVNSEPEAGTHSGVFMNISSLFFWQLKWNILRISVLNCWCQSLLVKGHHNWIH